MVHVPRSAALIAALFMLSTFTPGALGWGAKGLYEPDTTRDINDHWMFQGTDRSSSPSGHYVYFNGFEGMCSYPECTTASPNLATTRSSLHGSGYEAFALLGVWRDCNGDGYMGFGDQGLWEYRAELLIGPYDIGACPVQSFTPTNAQQKIIHNDGAWIHEFVPIQWKNWFADLNPFNINDNASRVWTDSGLPEDDLGTSASSACHIGPQPRGTYHNVGGLLYWADCFDGYQATDITNGLLHNGRAPGVTIGGQPFLPPTDTGLKADELGLGQLSFYDSPRYQGRSASVLNAKPWGEESDASYAQAWDCSQGTTRIDAPLSQAGVGQKDVHVTNVSQPSTSPATSTSGSLAGTTNATASGVDRCDRRTDAAGGGTGGAYARDPYEPGCAFSNVCGCFVHVPCEADEVSGITPGKTTTTGLVPIEQARPGGALSLVDKRAPPDAGVHLGPNTQRYSFGDQDLWETYVVPLSNAGTFYRTTYYAFVGAGAVAAYNLILPNGGTTGSYGAAACGSHGSGVYLGWQCDPAKWWRGPNGEDVRTRDTGCTLTDCSVNTPIDISIRVGSPFNLRDIDCTDLTVASQQRDAGLAPQTAEDTAYNNVGPILNAQAPGLFAASGPVHQC